MIRFGPLDKTEVLVDSIGGAVIPAFAHSHLCRDRVDKAVGDADDIPALLHVQVEGLRFELGQYIDAQKVGVDEVVEDKVDQPVAATEGDGRLAAGGGQRLQASTFATSQDHGQNACHRISLPELTT